MAEVFTDNGWPFDSKELSFEPQWGFIHTISSPYLQPDSYIEYYVRTLKMHWWKPRQHASHYLIAASSQINTPGEEPAKPHYNLAGQARGNLLTMEAIIVCELQDNQRHPDRQAVIPMKVQTSQRATYLHKHKEVLYNAGNCKWLCSNAIHLRPEPQLPHHWKQWHNFQENWRMLKLVDYTVTPEQSAKATVKHPALQAPPSSYPNAVKPATKCVFHWATSVDRL